MKPSSMVCLLLTALLGVGTSGAAAESASGVSPTTGLPSDKPYRPVLVQVSNEPGAQPARNLAQADIIYEAIIWEPGQTRYLALYNDNHPEAVGSVRGTRVYGAELQQAWDCAFAFRGGQDIEGSSIYSFFREYGVSDLLLFDGTADAKQVFSINSDYVSPHETDVNVAKIAENWPTDSVTGAPYVSRPSGLRFSDQHSTGVEAVTHIHLQYDKTGYAPSYLYNAETGLYERGYDGGLHVDAGTGEQIAVANVIVQCNDLYFIKDEPSRPRIPTTNTGPIRAYIDGEVIEGSWIRVSMSDPIEYRNASGGPLVLKPGKTFVQIVPPLMFDEGTQVRDETATYTNQFLYDRDPPDV